MTIAGLHFIEGMVRKKSFTNRMAHLSDILLFIHEGNQTLHKLVKIVRGPRGREEGQNRVSLLVSEFHEGRSDHGNRTSATRDRNTHRDLQGAEGPGGRYGKGRARS